MFHFLMYYRVRRDEEIVCYADVGCFRDDGPFNYLDMLPSPPEEVSSKDINSKKIIIFCQLENMFKPDSLCPIKFCIAFKLMFCSELLKWMVITERML